MPNLFEILPKSIDGKDIPSAFSLGMRIKIGQYESICPITDSLTYDGFRSEINLIKNELAEILKKLESIKNGDLKHGSLNIDQNKSPQEIWQVLSEIQDNSLLIDQFNSLNEDKRRELADYIFANCNMFSGKGAFFSARYIQENGLLTA